MCVPSLHNDINDIYSYLISQRMLIRFGQKQRCENTPLPEYLIALSGLVVLAGNSGNRREPKHVSSVGSLCRSTNGIRGLSHLGSVRLPRPATGAEAGNNFPRDEGWPLILLILPLVLQVFF